MKPATNFDVAKTVYWPGATPFCPCFAGQNPSGLPGSLPATFGLVADLARQFLPRHLGQTEFDETFPISYGGS